MMPLSKFSIFLIFLFLTSYLNLLWIVSGEDQNQTACLSGPNHKDHASPESELTECISWKQGSCCSADVSLEIQNNKAVNLWNFTWETCGPLSPECEQFLTDNVCFYQCEQRLALFADPNYHVSKGFVRDVPICADTCNAWFEACKNDRTCVSDWRNSYYWPGGDWGQGVNSCPDGSTCMTFEEMYGDGENLCNMMWGDSYKYETNEDNCMVMAFDSTHGNPNRLVQPYQELDACLSGLYQKDKPSPEPELVDCLPWTHQSCCSVNVSLEIGEFKAKHLWNINWDSCGPLSAQCEAFMKNLLCFSSCEPQLVLFENPNTPGNFRHVPICADYCNAWYEACRNDRRCNEENPLVENHCASDSCITYADMYGDGQGLCNMISGDLYAYETNKDNCMVMDFDENTGNPNRLVVPLQKLGICLSGNDFKDEPSPEDDLAECFSWKKQSCCSANVSLEIKQNKAMNLWNFTWDNCGPISLKCENFLKNHACFYQCEPRLKLFEDSNEPGVGKIRNVPICAEYCDAWFEACKDDKTCVANWMTGFDWSEGEFGQGLNSCPESSICTTFADMYGNGRGLCEKIWDDDYFYETNKDNCMVMVFDNRQGNPNHLVNPYIYYDSCFTGQHHRTQPSPEGQLGGCFQWKDQSCCHANVSSEIINANAKSLWNFHMDRCGPLSSKCEKFYKDFLCFYSCEPRLMLFETSQRGRLQHIPVCADYCDAWFEACKDDRTCAKNWAYDFDWSTGENHCLPGSSCLTYREMYEDGKDWCESIWADSYIYDTHVGNCMVMSFDYALGNPNLHVSPYQPLDTCLSGLYHKDKPSPEPELVECWSWTRQACCSANFTLEIKQSKAVGPYNFTWETCGAFSQRCERFLKRRQCFYQCEPRLALFEDANDPGVGNIRHVPICADYCDDWFESCKYDKTCVSNWHTGFDWSEGETYKGYNICPAGSTCVTFAEMYGNGTELCEKMFDDDFIYETDQNNCMVMVFDNTHPNPNRLVNPEIATTTPCCKAATSMPTFWAVVSYICVLFFVIDK